MTPTFDLSSIHLNAKNPRTISRKAFDTLCASIQRDPEFMVLRPIIIDDNRCIIGGNMRYRAITEGLGMTHCPPAWVYQAGKLTAEQRARFIVIDNAPPGASGEWDFAMLADQYSQDELAALGMANALDYVPPDNIEVPDYDGAGAVMTCPKCGFTW